jgi:hypothetical protein
MTKIAGSGSISQKHGSEDPDLDPPQNVMDPEHCMERCADIGSYNKYPYLVKQMPLGISYLNKIISLNVKYECVNRKVVTILMSSLGRYVFGSEISYNKAPPRLPGLGC